MKLSAVLAASAFVGSAHAWLGGHALFHQKRDTTTSNSCLTIVTVTVTVNGEEPTSTTTLTSTNVNIVTTTSSPSPSPPSTTSSPTSASPAPSSTTTQVAAPVQAVASSPSPSPSPSPSSVASSASPAQSSSAPQQGGACSIQTNGNKWAVVYTQYSSSGACQDAGTIMSDIAAIKSKGYTTIRMYGTDCSGLENIGAAVRANGMQMIIGIFIDDTGISGAQSQVTDIVAWGQAGNWDIVSMIVVGNEAVSSGACDAGSLAGFVASSKAAFQAAGSGCIPVTTTEPVDIIVNNADVFCPVIDVIGANVETFFNGGVLAADAGTFAQGQIAQIAGLCGGNKAYYNLESGWPSGGGNNGASVASPEAQAQAIPALVEAVGEITVMFSYQNDYWKPAGVDQNFGCFDVLP